MIDSFFFADLFTNLAATSFKMNAGFLIYKRNHRDSLSDWDSNGRVGSQIQLFMDHFSSMDVF